MKKEPSQNLYEELDIEEEIFPDILTSKEAYDLYVTLVGEHLLPFDVQYTITDSPAIFGELGKGKLIQQYGRIKGPPIKMGDEEIIVDGQIGMVIGDNHGRIIVQLVEYFLGWLVPAQFEVVNIIEPTFTYLQ
jgi:hypothetical protein